MNHFFRLRRAALTFAALAVLALAGPLPAAQAEPFSASGSGTTTDRDGNVFSGVVSGTARPVGDFSGVFAHKATSDDVDGSAVFDFGGGDTLEIDYHAEFNEHTGMYEGTYVVTGGTGVLEGATGSGSVVTTAGTTFEFTLSGTLSP
jgi:hypothetical protein